MNSTESTAADTVMQVTEFVEYCTEGFNNSQMSQFLMYLDGTVEDIDSLDADVRGAIDELKDWLT